MIVAVSSTFHVHHKQLLPDYVRCSPHTHTRWPSRSSSGNIRDHMVDEIQSASIQRQPPQADLKCLSGTHRPLESKMNRFLQSSVRPSFAHDNGISDCSRVQACFHSPELQGSSLCWNYLIQRDVRWLSSLCVHVA